MPGECRLAVVGLGQWARKAYLPNIERLEGVRIEALSTRSAANMDAALALLREKPRIYSDCEQLLRDGGFDALIVATASPSHSAVAGAALAAGYPVLCEKPLALTLEESRALTATARERGLALQVALEFRHAPVFVKAAALIEQGAVGTPVLTECCIFRDKKKGVSEEPERYLQHGGVFVEFLCHYLDIVTWLSAGQPERVSCQAGRHLDTDVYDYGAIEVEHSNGALAVTQYALVAPGTCQQISFRVLGETGRMDISLREGRILLAAEGEPQTLTMPEPGHPSQPYPGSLEQIRSFVEAVRCGEPARPDAQIWTQVMAIGAAAARSVAERCPVTLRDLSKQ